MSFRFRQWPLPCSILLAFLIGCAGGLPAVVSSTPNSVSIEFKLDGSVSKAGELAAKECQQHGKVSEFEAVDSVASPKTRIAKFRCISPAVSEAGPAS